MIRALPVLLAALLGCERREHRVFELLSPDRTGVTFANTIATSDSVNVQTEVYVYNGAGVAIGDVDNDGLSDLFFPGNMVTSRLYLNAGDMRFTDVTSQAGITTDRWATGATMADVNGDGFLDIYVSVSGLQTSTADERANLLFLSNGNRTFTEAAARYGIADTSFTTHSVFLDYDGDGCLDLFVLNNSPFDFSRGDIASPAGRRSGTPGGHNQLYRNSCNGRFTNVSKEAGILQVAGYGLGVAVGDLNGDGWPDIYVSNDATPNDVLYVNNGNGTFSDKAGRWLKHASFAGMGVDIADFNNDGWADILQVDMMPRELSTRKRMSGFMTYASLQSSRSRGFRDDFSENTLQLSNGVTRDGDVVFSEVARMAGVAATGWSWSALFADFDNDGFKDIFISNGYPKSVNDFDYQTAMFSTRRMPDSNAARHAGFEILKKLPAYTLPNHVFRNSGDLTFTERSAEWGVDQPSISYGAAYADLDNDGRLDLVVSNIDAPAFIYRNTGPSDDSHHWLQVRLQGHTPHQRGIGARLVLWAGGRQQHVYHNPYKGFMSSMDDRVHFGLGAARRVDSLIVLWPDGRRQALQDLEVDRIVTVKQADAAARGAVEPGQLARHWVFQPADSGRALPYRHESATLVDYAVQPLLPYMLSRHGPAIAAGDVNRDGLDDVFVGGGSGIAGQLFIQQADGGFAASGDGQPWEADKVYDDWGALFFDADGDSLPDLYVTSGGYHPPPGSRLLQDRFYRNAGGGRFVRDSAALPVMLTSTSTVRAGDFTGDGRPDLFVGGRLTPRQYPYPARSYLLRNDGGRFVDVTVEVAPALADSGGGGMITDAVWIDFDGDRRLDLVTAGEWMPLTFHRNEGRRFADVTRKTGLPPQRGWWYSLAAGDFDADGRVDLVAGNLGLNYSYATSAASRFAVYAGDFFGSQATHVVLTQEVEGVEYPVQGRVPLARELYQLGLKFPTYEGFSTASIRDLLSPDQLRSALRYEVDTFASVYLRNEGGGAFAASNLPPLAQISAIRGIVAHDVDGDGHLDLVVAGNLYDMDPNTAPADAGNGLWLRGDGTGRFTPVSPRESGFLAPKDVAGMALISIPAGKAVLVANTGDPVQTFVIRKR